MQKITPCLWYDTQAKEAAEFYVSIFKNSRVNSVSSIHDTPSGTVDLVSINLSGYNISMFSAGPLFKFTPAISLLVMCETKEEVDELWGKLSQGGSALMELGSYPFSERYGWTADKYGVSWQIMFAGDRPIKAKITPTLMYVGGVCGKAEEAINLYTSVFHNAAIEHILRYGKGAEPEAENAVMHGVFTLEGQCFAAMDSAREHHFNFNEAVSFEVRCETQEEMDYYTNKLSAVPEAEQCGWIKDAYGVSWQIVPTAMDAMMADKDDARRARVTQAMLKMKRLDLAELQKAYDGV